MRLFLIAKHWQIAIMQIIPILCIFFLGGVLSPLQIGFMWVLLIAVSVIWLYSIGLAANHLLEASLQKNELVFCITAIASVFVFITVLLIMYRSIQLSTQPPGWLIYVLFIGLGSFFYTLWYAASQFIAAEKNAETFYFLIVFRPVFSNKLLVDERTEPGDIPLSRLCKV